MKYYPIILSAEAAREVRAGMRTQDVRPVRFPRKWNDAITHDDIDKCGFWNAYSHESDRYFWQYGDDRLPNAWQSGDRLWVREPWTPNEMCACYDSCRCPSKLYKADHTDTELADWEDAPTWRSPVSMPRWASRTTLEITGVRVERRDGVWCWVRDFKLVEDES